MTRRNPAFLTARSHLSALPIVILRKYEPSVRGKYDEGAMHCSTRTAKRDFRSRADQVHRVGELRRFSKTTKRIGPSVALPRCAWSRSLRMTKEEEGLRARLKPCNLPTNVRCTPAEDWVQHPERQRASSPQKHHQQYENHSRSGNSSIGSSSCRNNRCSQLPLCCCDIVQLCSQLPRLGFQQRP